MAPFCCADAKNATSSVFPGSSTAPLIKLRTTVPHGLISPRAIGINRFTVCCCDAIKLGKSAVIRPLMLLAAGLVFATLAAPSAQAQEQEVRATHGSWEVICLKGSENCTMQQIGKSPQGEDAILVRISKVDATAQDGTKIPASAEIVAPLGVVLPAGVRVQVDGGQVRGTNYQVCIQIGCLAQDVVSEAFLADMKKGNSAKMIVMLPPNREVSVNISLTGFTKAFNSLKPLRRQQ